MSDPFSLIAAVFSAIATAFAAFATWQAPRAAAKLAEELRRDSEHANERRRSKLDVFAKLMQERAAIWSATGVGALNLVDIVFHDSREVREAWAELFLTFSVKPLPPHLLEERLRRLLVAMAKDIGIGDGLRTDDFGRVYHPDVMAQERLIKDLQRQQTLKSLQGGGSPAANTAPSTLWPPNPE